MPIGSITVQAGNGLSTTIPTYVLSYGCIYQGGFIYSVDDTTDASKSIGGKSAALFDSVEDSVNPKTQAWGVILRKQYPNQYDVASKEITPIG